jgi:hypothetical protein
MPPMLPEAPGATAGLVLGICSLVFSLPVIGLVLAFIGFQKSKEAKLICEMNPTSVSGYGLAKGGYVCSIVGMCVGAFSTLCGCGYFIIAALAIAGGAAGAGAAGP